MLSNNPMLKEIFKFNKSAVESAFNSLAKLTEQNEIAAGAILKNNPLIHEDQKTVINDMAAVYKKSCDDLKKMMDESFNQTAKLFDIQ